MFEPVRVMLYIIEYDHDMFEPVDFYCAGEVRNFL